MVFGLGKLRFFIVFIDFSHKIGAKGISTIFPTISVGTKESMRSSEALQLICN